MSPDPDQLTVDDLAHLTGVPSRTVRFYRQLGLLPAPRRVGRRAFYDRSQVDRLRLIGELRERGLALEAIAKILDEPRGEHVSAIVALTDELAGSWTDDQPAVMSRAEIVDDLAIAAEADVDERLENLVRLGVITPVAVATDDATVEQYRVPSTAMFGLARELKSTGLPPRVMIETWLTMQRHLDALARELVVQYLRDYAFLDVDPDADIATVARRVALRLLGQIFVQAMQQAMVDLIGGRGEAAPAGPDDPATDA